MHFRQSHKNQMQSYIYLEEARVGFLKIS